MVAVVAAVIVGEITVVVVIPIAVIAVIVTASSHSIRQFAVPSSRSYSTKYLHSQSQSQIGAAAKNRSHELSQSQSLARNHKKMQ